MEIHKPKPVHTPKEFLIELVTIVVGVSIALAAEALVERHRIGESVAFTRENFVDELTRNRREIGADLRDTIALDRRMGAVIKAGAEFAAGRAPFEAGGNIGRSFVRPRSAAWSSALSTQVMGHFPREPARAVAQAYNEQQAFTELQQAEQATWFGLAGDAFIGPPTRPGMAKAVGQMMVAYAYVHAHEDSERSLLAAYDQALEQLRKD